MSRISRSPSRSVIVSASAARRARSARRCSWPTTSCWALDGRIASRRLARGECLLTAASDRRAGRAVEVGSGRDRRSTLGTRMAVRPRASRLSACQRAAAALVVLRRQAFGFDDERLEPRARLRQHSRPFRAASGTRPPPGRIAPPVGRPPGRCRRAAGAIATLLRWKPAARARRRRRASRRAGTAHRASRSPRRAARALGGLFGLALASGDGGFGGGNAAREPILRELVGDAQRWPASLSRASSARATDMSVMSARRSSPRRRAVSRRRRSSSAARRAASASSMS